MEMEEIGRGWSVYTEDGKRVGDVVEVHPHYLLVSRGLLVVRDVYVPRYAVAGAENGKVQLALPEDRLRRMGWNAPPPPPPVPLDSPTPQLVPNYEPDEPGPPPLEFSAHDDTSAFAADATESYYPDTDIWSQDQGYSEPILDDYEDMGIMFGPTVEVDGEAYLAVRRVGEGPAIVFIHGWGFDARIWDTLTLDLPHDYTVVTYNARGYAGSTAPWTGYDVERISRDLRVLLRTLELENATLVGLDAGAAAALHYALSGGRRAGRLVLIAPPSFTPGAAPAALQEWEAELRRDRPRLAVRLAELWAPGASPDTHAWLRESVLAAAPYALQRSSGLLGYADVGGDPAAVTLPTLVLHGTDDPVAPLAQGEAIAAAIPGARLVALEGQGHLPMLSDPERIVAEIRAFIVPDGDEDYETVTASDDEAAPAEMIDDDDTV